MPNKQIFENIKAEVENTASEILRRYLLNLITVLRKN